MKKSKCTEPPDFAFFKDSRGWKKSEWYLPRVRHIRTHILQWEEQVWRSDAFRVENGKEVGGRKCALETHRCRTTTFYWCSQRGKLKKEITSYQKEQCLAYIQESFPKLSHIKTCKLLNCSRNNRYYKKLKPQKDVAVGEVIKEVMGTSRLGGKK